MPELEATQVSPPPPPATRTAPSPRVIVLGAPADAATLADSLRRSLRDLDVHAPEWPRTWRDLTKRGVPACVLFPCASARSSLDLIRDMEERDASESLVLLTRAEEGACEFVARHRLLHVLPWPAPAHALDEVVRTAVARSERSCRTKSERELRSQQLENLTARELEVLALIQLGHSSKSIAHELSISKRTVDDHRHSMLNKTGFDTVTAVSHALDRLRLLDERNAALSGGRWRPETPTVGTPA